MFAGQRKFNQFTALVLVIEIKQKSSTRTVRSLPLSQVHGQCFSVKEIQHGNLHTEATFIVTQDMSLVFFHDSPIIVFLEESSR